MSEAIEKITVVLGEYKGIKLPKMEVTVTEEELQEELKRAQQMAATKEPKEDAAETGDETVIDFVGYKDGVAFPGGDGSDYPLVLGSGSFIPGFEEQLVGSKKGDHVEVKVSCRRSGWSRSCFPGRCKRSTFSKTSGDRR